MKKILASFLTIFFFAIQLFAQVQVKSPACENLVNPIGLDAVKPRFSWQLDAPNRNCMQTSYEIKVSTDAAGKNAVWSSGKVASSQSVFVEYAGQPLKSATKYYWQVRVWDNNTKTSPWSAVNRFITGLFDAGDWKAKWIEPGYTEEASRPSPMFRKQFATSKKVASAIAYVTGHGMYEAQINGKRVGDAYLTPGWTSYNKRLQYQVYDVTSLLNQGQNAIGVSLGSGWYRGHLAWGENKDIYGKTLGLLFQLQIEYTDGSKETVVSDESWKSSTGAVRFSEIYDGEIIDSRLDKKGWSQPGYDDSQWSGVKTAAFGPEKLIATYNEPIRKHETFPALRVWTTPKGEQVIDFGQNLVGWVTVKASGKSGDKIVISHAEVLDKQGNFYIDNLRAAKEQNEYILSGNGVEEFEPHFTFQGFRYIKVEGYPGTINLENFKAVTLYSDMPRTGTFSSSNVLLNQLQHNIQWGQRGNFLDVPTDCPQRDERLGWTGDAQVFSRTASFNMGVNNFFSKWLKDVAADQGNNGSVPFVVPNVLGPNAGGSAGWADVATIVPWNMWLAYGDKRILEDQYPSMKAWVGYMEKASKNDLWNTGFHFGDWLFYRPDDDNDGRSAITDKYLIAQAFFAHSTQLLINTAKVLGKTDDVNSYSVLLEKIKAAFLKEYMTPSGRLVSGSQTAYVLALNFDMLPESLRAQAAERLVQNIKSYDNHLTTGFLGTPYLCHVLTRFGYPDVAYTLLMQDTYPSWLYPVKMGATTIWERWDGQKPDSSFQTPGMNSFNHYAYGAIGDWMYRSVVGIDTDDSLTGYKMIQVKPHIGGGLANASASLKTNYGMVAAGWKNSAGTIELDVEIPANTRATVYIPLGAQGSVSESGAELSTVKGIESKGKDKNYAIVSVGSGKYHFVSK